MDLIRCPRLPEVESRVWCPWGLTGMITVCKGFYLWSILCSLKAEHHQSVILICTEASDSALLTSIPFSSLNLQTRLPYPNCLAGTDPGPLARNHLGKCSWSQAKPQSSNLTAQAKALQGPGSLEFISRDITAVSSKGWGGGGHMAALPGKPGWMQPKQRQLWVREVIFVRMAKVHCTVSVPT